MPLCACAGGGGGDAPEEDSEGITKEVMDDLRKLWNRRNWAGRSAGEQVSPTACGSVLEVVPASGRWVSTSTTGGGHSHTQNVKAGQGEAEMGPPHPSRLPKFGTGRHGPAPIGGHRSPERYGNISSLAVRQKRQRPCGCHQAGQGMGHAGG